MTRSGLFTAFRFCATLALVTMVGALAAHAGQRQKYDAAAFAAAQKSGKPVLVHVSAPWCPTCKAQKPIVDMLGATPEFKDLVVYEVDFDSDREALKAFNARSQSTLIVFKGATEVGRSVGDTKKESIEALISGAF
jgi:thiol-disulfide isomerase/thioredoxin